MVTNGTSENQPGRGERLLTRWSSSSFSFSKSVARFSPAFSILKEMESADPGSNFPLGPSASLANSRVKCRKRPAQGNELHTIEPRSQSPLASCCSYYRLGRCDILVQLSLNNPKAFEGNAVPFSPTSNQREMDEFVTLTIALAVLVACLRSELAPDVTFWGP